MACICSSLHSIGRVSDCSLMHSLAGSSKESAKHRQAAQSSANHTTCWGLAEASTSECQQHIQGQEATAHRQLFVGKTDIKQV